jgi:hypothetical protein
MTRTTGTYLINTTLGELLRAFVPHALPPRYYSCSRTLGLTFFDALLPAFLPALFPRRIRHILQVPVILQAVFILLALGGVEGASRAFSNSLVNTASCSTAGTS